MDRWIKCLWNKSPKPTKPYGRVRGPSVFPEFQTQRWGYPGLAGLAGLIQQETLPSK